VLVVGGLLNLLMGQLVSKTGLSGTDRVLGVAFGVARGVVLIGVTVLLAGLTVLPEDPWWRESQLIGHFERLALWMRSFLPVDVAANIRYD
jgi:membrane protein required for colicin V production